MPINANFYYKIPKDASYVTLRNQNRMLYANYRIQQNNVQQGCQGVTRLQDGGVADADIIPKLLEGARETTALEIQVDISSAACPVSIPVVIVNPYLTDKIYLALTTSAAAYQAAAAGDWVKVTSTEYAALKTGVTSTTTVGADNTLMAGATQGIVALTSIFANRYNGTSRVAIPTNNYFFAVAFVTNRDNQTGIRIFVNTNSTSTTGYVQQGTALPATTVPSGTVTQYYVLKGQSTATSASNSTSIAAYSPSTVTTTGIQVTTDPVVATNAIDWVNTGGSVPTSSTVLSSNYTGYVVMLQGISASSIQWVT